MAFQQMTWSMPYHRLSERVAQTRSLALVWMIDQVDFQRQFGVCSRCGRIQAVG